jgi:tRNA threonylcarbamoyladenosine biosynthesis protein TsaE
MHGDDHIAASCDLADEAATGDLAAVLAGVVEPGLVVWLEGDLGAGKTAFVRALLRALGYGGPVKSPTYALVELYNLSRLCLYHFDLYRLKCADEFLDAGLAEYFDGSAACFIEWPEKGGRHLPPADLRLEFAFAGAGRRVVAQAVGKRGGKCLSAMIGSGRCRQWPG